MTETQTSYVSETTTLPRETETDTLPAQTQTARVTQTTTLPPGTETQTLPAQTKTLTGTTTIPASTETDTLPAQTETSYLTATVTGTSTATSTATSTQRCYYPVITNGDFEQGISNLSPIYTLGQSDSMAGVGVYSHRQGPESSDPIYRPDPSQDGDYPIYDGQYA